MLALRSVVLLCCTSAGNLILVNVANVACGFYGMRAIDVPLFLCFRRTSVAFALVMEYICFSRKPAGTIALAVALTCVGALVAGAPVMQSNWVGVMWMLGNNTFTALSLTMVRIHRCCWWLWWWWWRFVVVLVMVVVVVFL